jgi:hypothetical protein
MDRVDRDLAAVAGRLKRTSTEPFPVDARAGARSETPAARSRDVASTTVPSGRTAAARRSRPLPLTSTQATSQTSPSKATTGPLVISVDDVATRRPKAGSSAPEARVTRKARISVASVAAWRAAKATGSSRPAATSKLAVSAAGTCSTPSAGPTVATVSTQPP